MGRLSFAVLGCVASLAVACSRGHSKSAAYADDLRTDAAAREGTSDLVFPRIASYFIETYIGPEHEETMSRADVVVVDVEATASSADALKRVRTKNPTADLLAYLTSEEIPYDIDPEERPLAAERFAKITPSEWLLEPGSKTATAVTASATRIKVDDLGAFSVTRPSSDFHGEDEPTFLLLGDEHVKLVAVDGDELVVERGHRSTAKAHPAGTRVAAHVVFFAGTWMLNLSATAPRSPAGTTWRDRLVDDAAELVAKGPWTGVFLDVCFEDISWLNGGHLDVDANGKADDPKEASRQWSRGMGLVVDALRARVGDGVPIIANPGGQNCPHPKLDGVLLEGWPIGLPSQYLSFEKGLDRYLAWAPRGRHMTIANAFSPKIGFGTIAEGADAEARTDYAAMRFGLGVALLGDGLYAFDNGVFGHYVTWWYDEYDGAGLGRGWLGRAKSGLVGDGPVKRREFEHGLVVVNTGASTETVDVPTGFAKLAGQQDPRHNDGGDVTGTLTVAAKDAYVLRRK